MSNTVIAIASLIGVATELIKELTKMLEHHERFTAQEVAAKVSMILSSVDIDKMLEDEELSKGIGG